MLDSTVRVVARSASLRLLAVAWNDPDAALYVEPVPMNE